MKKISALFLAFAMLFAIIPFAALAETPTIDEALNVQDGMLKFNAKDWEVVCEEADDVKGSDVTGSDPEVPAGRLYAKSQNHDDDSSSQIKLVANVNAGDILTFEAKTSCEEGYDGLVVSVDGEDIIAVTGENDWADYYYIFEDEGTYVVTWKYVKDASDYAGEDCAYLDNVYLGENSFELEDIDVPESLTLVPGYEAVIDVKPVPAFAPIGEVTFASDNEEVATVDEQGVVKAVAVGEATITVKEETLDAKEVKVSVVEPKLANAFIIYDDSLAEDEDAVYGLAEVEMNTGLYKVKLPFADFLKTYMADTWFGPMEYLENVNAAEYLDGKVYMFTDTGRFVVIDAETHKVETEVGDLETGAGLQTAYTVADMAFDYATYTMYGLAWGEGDYPYLVNIDTETGDVTEIAEFNFAAYELAAHEGILYTVADDGTLYTVTPAGEAKAIGQTGVAPAYLQTMAFDHETGALYWLGIGADANEDPEEAELFSFIGTIDVEKAELTYAVTDTIVEFTGLYFEYEDTTEKVAVTGVTLDKTEVELKWHEQTTLTATVAPENATNKNVTWTSSDETVATVKNGVVTALAKGEATITVTTKDGGFKAECKVTVTDEPTFLLNESFEPAKDGAYQVEGWKVIDADKDGYGWDAYAEDGITAYDGVGVMTSASYINDVGALTPDNWLISPAFKAYEQTTASWYVAAQDPGYADENYAVYVVPAEYTEEDLAALKPVYEGTATGAWVNVTVDISEYAGKDVRLAFRHYNTTDMYWIKLDLVQVYTFAETEPAIPDVVFGDVNGDEKINTADAVLILKYAADMVQFDEKQLEAANVNFDDKVNTADAVLVLKYAADMLPDGFVKPVE